VSFVVKPIFFPSTENSFFLPSNQTWKKSFANSIITLTLTARESSTTID